MANSKFIGSGITFPIILNDDGRPDFVNDINLILSSIKMVLYWPRHTRFFNEFFGARLEELIEEPNDGIAKSILRTFVKESLETFERRIKVIDVRVRDYDLYTVNIEIKISIRNEKIEETFIFPYYKNLI